MWLFYTSRRWEPIVLCVLWKSKTQNIAFLNIEVNMFYYKTPFPSFDSSFFKLRVFVKVFPGSVQIIFCGSISWNKRYNWNNFFELFWLTVVSDRKPISVQPYYNRNSHFSWNFNDQTSRTLKVFTTCQKYLVTQGEHNNNLPYVHQAHQNVNYVLPKLLISKCRFICINEWMILNLLYVFSRFRVFGICIGPLCWLS